MKNLILSTLMTLSIVGYGQTMVKSTHIPVWSHKAGGYTLKELSKYYSEAMEDTLYVFKYRNQAYTHITDTKVFLFENKESVVNFFNMTSSLYEGTYDPNKKDRVEYRGAFSFRTRGMFGVKICLFNEGSAWCYLEENYVNEILQSLNPQTQPQS
jgi:hypothetical protein